MSFTTIFLAVLLSIVFIVAAAALMRLLTAKVSTDEQAQAEAEKLPLQVNQDVKIRRRVRAGASATAISADFPHFASLSATRIRFPSV
jgi:CHASE1-domain containing sensor protein